MTVSSSTSRADYIGNGATTAFAVPFYFLDNTHLKVIRTVNGVATTLVLNSDYTVSGAGVAAGGTVTLTTAPASGAKLSILRNMPFTQLTKYTPNDPFPAASHETALDQRTMENIQLKEAIGRAVVLPENSSGVSATLPAPAAGNLLGWDSNAVALTNYDLSSLATTVVYGTAKGDLFTGNGVQTVFTLSQNPGSLYNLDVDIGGVTQHPGVDFTWNGTTGLTTTVPVPNGVAMYVRYSQALPNVPTPNYPKPSDYGAAGDGVTDDTAALARLHAANLVVDYGDRNKNYKVTGTIALRDYTTIVGSGARVTQTSLQTPTFNAVGKIGVTIRGIDMTGASMSTATAGAFVVGRRYSIRYLLSITF